MFAKASSVTLASTHLCARLTDSGVRHKHVRLAMTFWRLKRFPGRIEKKKSIFFLTGSQTNHLFVHCNVQTVSCVCKHVLRDQISSFF